MLAPTFATWARCCGWCTDAMTISDAQFAQMLRHGGSEIAVIAEIEFAYESGGSMATGTIRLADTADAVAGTPYADAIEDAPVLERAIDLARLGGRGSRSVGSMTLNNADGAFDYLLDVIIDGRDCTIAIGGHGWARADYRTVCVGAVAAVKAANDDQITIELRDKNFLLDDTMVGAPITTGPNAGKPRPILLGHVNNFDITPYLYDVSNLRYYVHTTSLSPNFRPSDVRDAGASLRTASLFTFDSGSMTVNTGTETLTYSSPHNLAVNDVVYFTPLSSGTLFGLAPLTQYWVIAAGLTANDFRLSLTKGGSAVNLSGGMTDTWITTRQRYYYDAAGASIELSAAPEGRVTIDLQAVDVGEVMLQGLPHEILQYVLLNHVKPLDFDTAPLTALIAAENAQGAQAGFAILDRVNVLDLFDEIAGATYSWYGWRADGVLTFGRLDMANLDAANADDTIDEGDILGELSAENLTLQAGKLVLDVNRNVVTQDDGLVASVAAEDRSLWTQPYRLRATTTDPGTNGYLANWWDYHVTAIESAPRPTCLQVTTTPAQNIVDAITAEFRPWTRPHRCTVGLDKYALNPGDCVTLTYPRYGLAAGKNCRVISVKPRVSDREVDLVLVRQALPDYLAA